MKIKIVIIIIVSFLMVRCSEKHIIISDDLRNDLVVELFYANECIESESDILNTDIDGYKIKSICQKPVSSNADYSVMRIVKYNKQATDNMLLIEFKNRNKFKEVFQGEHLFVVKYNNKLSHAVYCNIVTEKSLILLAMTENDLKDVKIKNKLYNE